MVHPQSNGVGELVFGDGPANPVAARLDAVQGQQDASQLGLHSGIEKKVCLGSIWQIWRVGVHLYALAAICHPGLGWQCRLLTVPVHKPVLG